MIPSVDISETDGEFNVRAALPGLDKNDLDGEEDKKDKSYYFRENYFGSFQRSVRLPAEVKSDKVEALFKDGILKYNHLPGYSELPVIQ